MEGNTDQLGRNAWSGFIDELQEAVTAFINEKNHLFVVTEDLKKQKLKAYCNAIDQICQGYNSATDEEKRDMDLLIKSYNNDINHIQEDTKEQENVKFHNIAEDFLLEDQSPVILTRTFNNSYDVTYGFILTNVSTEEWALLFASVEACKKPQAELDRITQIAAAGGDNNDPRNTEMKKIACKALNSKDTIRTLSSCMERNDWSHCGLVAPHNCCMLNMKRTADIAVCVIAQTPKDELTYPIFIGEVLGKKEAGSHNEQTYEGYTAALQALVFAPRGYYWEIPINVAKMYCLERDPVGGQILINDKTYNLTSSRNGTPHAMLEILRDLTCVFFYTLINLKPIAEYSACELYKANYREFLSSALEGGCQTNIRTHCWHVFTPRSAEWDDFTPPPSYHPNDAEDPEKPPVQKESRKKRYSIKCEGAAIPVTDSTYDFDRADPSFIQKMAPVHSI